jgi:[ribosomal protein S5]-alanine N-acetyltransferase
MAVTARAVLQTDRLALREFSTDDDGFVLDLLNQPSFLHYIGDRGVRTLEDARTYIAQGPLKSYEDLGYGLYVVTLKDDGTPMGMCGIVHKPWLNAPDIAYAFLPQYEGRGYASEAARAVLEHARSQLGITVVLGVVTFDNNGSVRVLEKLSFSRESTVIDPRSNTQLLLFANRG